MDDLGWPAISSFLNTHVLTDHVDRLAAIEYSGNSIGQFLDALDGLRLTQKTMLVF